MIIDPSRDGCTIWEGDGVQFIEGNPIECCDKIIEFISDTIEGKLHQWYTNIGLDTVGIGMAYADYFISRNVIFHKIKPKNILKKKID